MRGGAAIDVGAKAARRPADRGAGARGRTGSERRRRKRGHRGAEHRQRAPCVRRAGPRRGRMHGAAADVRARAAAPFASPGAAQYLTPQALHSAYSLPTETQSSSTQTIAVIDAFDDPTAEADLGVYDQTFGLPSCTSANGCFRKLNEHGQASPLPPVEGEWASEISIDVQMAHAICQNCHVLLVEASSEEFSDLGAAVDAAVKAGATEVSNSYGGPENRRSEPLLRTTTPATTNTPVSSSPPARATAATSTKAAAAGSPQPTFPPHLRTSSPSAGRPQQTQGSLEQHCLEGWGQRLQRRSSAAPPGRARSLNSQDGLRHRAFGHRRGGDRDPETGVDVYDSTPEDPGDRRLGSLGRNVGGASRSSRPSSRWRAAPTARRSGRHALLTPRPRRSPLRRRLRANGNAPGTSLSGGCRLRRSARVGSPIGLGAFAVGGEPVRLASRSFRSPRTVRR